nr:hypothetical protein [Tanacetum cinerariifolium]
MPSTSEYDVFVFEDTPLVTPGLAPLPPFVSHRDTFLKGLPSQTMTIRRTTMVESYVIIINPIHQPELQAALRMIIRIAKHLATTSSAGLVHRVISRLTTELSMIDLGELSYFLGIVANRSSSGLFWFQLPFARDIIAPAGDNIVSCSSKRQNVVSRSSAEADYRGVANVVAKVAWLHNLLLELSYPLKRTTIVFCDNEPSFRLQESVA